MMAEKWGNSGRCWPSLMRSVVAAMGALLCAMPAAAIPIDNSVIASSVQCSGEAITVSFETSNPFTGRIYAKGNVDKDDCVQAFNTSPPSNTPMVNFTFGSCSMQRQRTLAPSRGMMQSLVVVISFHPIFLTKVDRAYKVQCFYMEAEKQVTSNLEVSMLTTDSLRDTAGMPACTYTVHRGSVDGEPVRFAQIGEEVYHEWKCDSDSHDLLVKSCFVDDGAGNRYEILDDNGCSIDPVIMGNLNYDSEGPARAWVEAHVFKFADKPNVFFQCVVQLCNRGEPGCDAVTPPTCPDGPLGVGIVAAESEGAEDSEGGRARRGARRHNGRTSSEMRSSEDMFDTVTFGRPNEMDLSSQSIKIFDLEDSWKPSGDTPSAAQLQKETLSTAEDQIGVGLSGADHRAIEQYATVCMSPTSFGLLMTIILIVFVVACGVAVLVYMNRLRPYSEKA